MVRKHADQEDEYNPKNAKQVGNHRDYFILDKIRAIYNWVIDEVKIELRRKYIHDDKSFKIIEDNNSYYIEFVNKQTLQIKYKDNMGVENLVRFFLSKISQIPPAIDLDSFFTMSPV